MHASDPGYFSLTEIRMSERFCTVPFTLVSPADDPIGIIFLLEHKNMQILFGMYSHCFAFMQLCHA